MPAVTFISAIPNFASQEEHASAVNATPNSFSEIPPLLNHQETNVSVTLDPPLEGYESAVQGTLYVLTRYVYTGIFILWWPKKNYSVLVFMPQSGASGFQIKYPAITLHAVSRGEAGPAIYCQLDETYGDTNGVSVNPTAENENEDTEMRELTIFPQRPEAGAFSHHLFGRYFADLLSFS